MKASLALLPFEVEAKYESLIPPLNPPQPPLLRGVPKAGDLSADLVIIDANVLKDNPSSLQNLKTPAILIHAQDFTGDREALKKSGFAGFYTKPFLVEEWVEIIRSALVR